MADYNSSYTGAQIDAGIGKANTAYQKPSSGIPLTDLASQGTTNAGKFVVVGSDGKLTIAAINSAGGVSF